VSHANLVDTCVRTVKVSSSKAFEVFRSRQSGRNDAGNPLRCACYDKRRFTTDGAVIWHSLRQQVKSEQASIWICVEVKTNIEGWCIALSLGWARSDREIRNILCRPGRSLRATVTDNLGASIMFDKTL
jgi:hypothetical protein